MRLLREEAAAFLLAVQFMTRLPLGNDRLYSAERFLRSRAHYPLIGLLIGGFCAAVFWAASVLFDPLLAILLAVAAGIVLSGALHEDGLADVCDGLGGGSNREDALEIMKDSRLGTYGVLGLVLVLGAKILALSELPLPLVPWALIAGHSVSRAALLCIICCEPYARTEGTAKAADGTMPALALAFAFAVAAVAMAGPLVALDWPVGYGLLVAAVVGALLGLLAVWYCIHKKLGGYTGDCLGAAQQTSETGLYLAVAALF